MDLLDKIRQKARQEQDIRNLDASLPLESELPESTVIHEAESTQQISDDEDLDFVQNVETVTVQNAFPEIPQKLPPAHRIVQRDPLEAILAGREAAGCGEDLPLVSKTEIDTEQDNHQEFLCFKVSNEVYGVDIMDIKELIRPREVTEVPGRHPLYPALSPCAALSFRLSTCWTDSALRVILSRGANG